MTNLRAWRIFAGYMTATEAHRAIRRHAKNLRLSLSTYRRAESGDYPLRETARRAISALYGAPDALQLLITAPPTTAATTGPVQPGPGRRSHRRRNTPSLSRRPAAQTKVEASQPLASTETK